MNIIFRTDSSYAIGTGHLMRCLTLADDLAKHGINAEFVCRDLPGNCNFLAEEKGYKVHKVNNDIDDAKETIKICQQLSEVDWLIVDNYALDENWERQLRPYVNKIMVIDDLANRNHDCDLLLDQNFYENMEVRYDNLVPDTCKKLLGPKFALLRDEFVQQRTKLRERDGEIKRILIFFGGSDPDNLTEVAIEAIKALNKENIITDIVVGAANAKKAYLKEHYAELPNFNVHCQINNMAELMANADLAIGAGGSTTWERCCLGLPSIVIPIADNQIQITKDMAVNGYIFATENITLLSQVLGGLITCSSLMGFIAQRNLSLVDGMGLNRITQNMFPYEIKLREVMLEDCDNILAWRNAEETRLYSFDKALIDSDTHNKWFNNIIKDNNEIMLIAEINKQPMGVLRYTIGQDCAQVSVYLIPGHYGYGYGPRLLEVGDKWLRKYRPNVKLLFASVLSDNERSRMAFIKAGFYEDQLVLKKKLGI